MPHKTALVERIDVECPDFNILYAIIFQGIEKVFRVFGLQSDLSVQFLGL